MVNLPAQVRISEHAHRMIRIAWALGGRRELEDLRLRAWAHMLGFRGHFSTKTRRYSTTLGALRTARAEMAPLQVAIAHGHDPAHGDDTTLVLAHWTFAGPGLTRAEQWLAASLTTTAPERGTPDA